MPIMKKNLMVIAIPAILLSLLAGQLFRVDIQETLPRVSHIIHSDLVQLYSLRQRADSTHVVKISATDGTVWFREEEPGFSLDCCDPRRAYIQEFVAGEFSVILTVQENCWGALERWCRTRLEKIVGIVVDGDVVYAQPLKEILKIQIAIPISGTNKEAQEFLTRILSEGFEKLP